MANDYRVTLTGQDKLSGVIKNVQKELKGTGDTAKGLDKIRNNFDKIQSSSAPLRSKISNIKKQMELLAVSGERTTKQGQEMWNKLSEQAKEYDKILKDIAKDTNGVGSLDVSVGSNGFNLGSIAGDLAGQAGLGGVTSSLNGLVSMANPATAALAATAGVMVAAGKAAGDFEKHLDGLQSLTGLTDTVMQAISDRAIDMSKEFKSSAGDIVDAAKIIGSQAPELLSNADALMDVTEAANVLSEAAEIDVVDAAKGITTVMNQMGVSSKSATDIINVLAAASQQGAADVSYLQTAFEKSGTAAASAGMGYVDLAAIIETVAPKFSSADVAGSQFASTLLALSTQTNDNFKPAVVGINQALDNLANAQMNDAELSKLVGASNITMIKTLMQGRDTLSNYQNSLEGTNTAYDQMAINSDNLEGYITRLKSAWDAFLLTLGQSGVLQGIADNIMHVMTILGEVMNVLSDVVNSFKAFDTAGVEVDLLASQLDMLSNIIKGVGAALQIIVTLAAKVFNSMKEYCGQAADWMGNRWNELKKKLGDVAFAKVIINAFKSVISAAQQVIGRVKKLWNEFLSWLGLEAKSIDVNVSPNITVDMQTDLENNNGSNGHGSGGSNNKGPGKTKSVIKTSDTSDKNKSVDQRIEELKDDGSEYYYESLIKLLNEKRSKLSNNTPQKEIDTLNQQINNAEKKLKVRKLELHPDLSLPPNSIAQLEKDLSEAEDVLKKMNTEMMSDEEVSKAKNKINDLKKEIESKKIKLGLVVKDSDPSIKAIKDSKQFENGSVDDKRMSYQNAQSNFNRIRENYKNGIIDEKLARKQINDIDEQLGNLELKRIEPKFRISYDGKVDIIPQDEIDKELQNVLSKISSFNDQLYSSISSLMGSDSYVANLCNGLNQLSDDCIKFAEDFKLMTNTMSDGTAYTSIAAEGIGMLGQAMITMGADGGIAKAGAVLASIGQVILGFATASAQAAKLGPFGWIAFIGAGLATLATTIATIKGFADGGIIQGNSFHGDNVLIRANAGEMVLNKKQQSNLYDALDTGRTNGVGGGHVRFEITGDKLYGVLRNYNNKMGKIR